MKKIILILSLTLLPANAFAKCVEDPDMKEVIIDEDGDRIAIHRCENKEAVCYRWGPSISCFRK